MANDVLEFFCRHLIGIGWYEGKVNDDGEFTEQPVFCGASGFLLQLHDGLPSSLALITAGHVFTDYRERMSKPKMGAKNHSLLDIWGPHSPGNQRIPFNLFDYPAFFTFDKQIGVDIAVVLLPNLMCRLLDQTTTPFTKTNCTHQSNISFDFFAMLGLPNEDAEQITSREEKSITTFQNPAMLFLAPCRLPSGSKTATNPQFVAKINAPSVDLDSIVGMSGGPIFGFHMNADGQLAYWPVAIQSRWLPDKRIVIGTFLAPVAAAIEQAIEELLAQSST